MVCKKFNIVVILLLSLFVFSKVYSSNECYPNYFDKKLKTYLFYKDGKLNFTNNAIGFKKNIEDRLFTKNYCLLLDSAKKKNNILLGIGVGLLASGTYALMGIAAQKYPIITGACLVFISPMAVNGGRENGGSGLEGIYIFAGTGLFLIADGIYYKSNNQKKEIFKNHRFWLFVSAPIIGISIDRIVQKIKERKRAKRPSLNN